MRHEKGEDSGREESTSKENKTSVKSSDSLHLKKD